MRRDSTGIARKRARERGRARQRERLSAATTHLYRSAYTYYKSVSVALIRSAVDAAVGDRGARRRCNVPTYARCIVARIHYELASGSRAGGKRRADRALTECALRNRRFREIRAASESRRAFPRTPFQPPYKTFDSRDRKKFLIARNTRVISRDYADHVFHANIIDRTIVCQ